MYLDFIRIPCQFICGISVAITFKLGCSLLCLLIAVKAVDALMESQWAKPKEGDETFFASRADVVEFLDR
jgi:hypothetical protein